ncbi:MAG: glycosyltransferase family 2 protein, partial [Gammaproteobacteria bacterium]|nr:glycosyltransferase family 2 protein [Gammaproteobacteria bacterium]
MGKCNLNDASAVIVRNSQHGQKDAVDIAVTITAPSCSIVIPCYDEAKNIPLVLERCREAFTGQDIELVLVDNGSCDGTAELLCRLLPDYPFARSVRVEVNQGYGFGILAGLRSCNSEILGWTHADMQTDPADIPKALRLMQTCDNPGSCFVKGTRVGRRLSDNLFTLGMSIFESLLLLKPMWEINAQPVLFRRSFFLSWN